MLCVTTHVWGGFPVLPGRQWIANMQKKAPPLHQASPFSICKGVHTACVKKAANVRCVHTAQNTTAEVGEDMISALRIVESSVISKFWY